MLSDEMRYKVLSLLKANPRLSQRELAGELGISLGRLNYCVRALAERGLIKVERFRTSANKMGYLYKLTPAGVSEKFRVTRRFLARKLEEHERISVEIERLRREVDAR